MTLFAFLGHVLVRRVVLVCRFVFVRQVVVIVRVVVVRVVVVRVIVVRVVFCPAVFVGRVVSLSSTRP